MWYDKCNEQAADIQRQLGIDPELCMKLLPLRFTGYTEDAAFSEAIANRIWPTATFGNAKNHDKMFHVAKVGMWHPEIVSVFAEAAKQVITTRSTRDQPKSDSTFGIQMDIAMSGPIPAIDDELADEGRYPNFVSANIRYITRRLLLPGGITPTTEIVESLTDLQVAHTTAYLAIKAA